MHPCATLGNWAVNWLSQRISWARHALLVLPIFRAILVEGMIFFSGKLHQKDEPSLSSRWCEISGSRSGQLPLGAEFIGKIKMQHLSSTSPSLVGRGERTYWMHRAAHCNCKRMLFFRKNDGREPWRKKRTTRAPICRPLSWRRLVVGNASCAYKYPAANEGARCLMLSSFGWFAFRNTPGTENVKVDWHCGNLPYVADRHIYKHQRWRRATEHNGQNEIWFCLRFTFTFRMYKFSYRLPLTTLIINRHKNTTFQTSKSSTIFPFKVRREKGS